MNQRIYACAKASASVTFTANQSCSWFSPWQQMNWQDEFSNSKKRYASDIIIIIIRSITEAADGRDSGNEGWDEERDYKDREKQRWRDRDGEITAGYICSLTSTYWWSSEERRKKWFSEWMSINHVFFLNHYFKQSKVARNHSFIKKMKLESFLCIILMTSINIFMQYSHYCNAVFLFLYIYNNAMINELKPEQKYSDGV